MSVGLSSVLAWAVGTYWHWMARKNHPPPEMFAAAILAHVTAAVSVGEIVNVVVGVTFAVVGVSVTLAKFRDLKPVAWLLDRLVIGPASQALDRRIDVRVDAVTVGFAQSMGVLTEKVSAIHYEIHPNSGTSMRDAISRIEGTGIYTQGEVEGLKEDVADLRERTARLEGSIEVLKER